MARKVGQGWPAVTVPSRVSSGGPPCRRRLLWKRYHLPPRTGPFSGFRRGV
ncbi:hypothetical protein DGo_CA2458 [Deinococcus gobiensis I-0]|uniref:Uncharacterized protein n=1 Tax=Deinococcus gobiensis (strain DSM 21396 / JCM 16679 / CGMCC 1.7299 / I-0) TaxID=745776 RepID=H8GRZ4_DEIGI|nr:hypothetical protein DGo_CA2458 [Deinococcus gobiensis I-0]